jgi:ribose transport system substrate-binding protein
VVHVGFDTSAKLTEALENGTLAGLVLQDPFRMGYESVKAAVAHLRGLPYEKYLDTGVLMATPENMNQPEIHRLLVPDLSVLDR